MSPNITAELNEKGELIGIENLEASLFIRDSILESEQANMLNLSEAYNIKDQFRVEEREPGTNPWFTKPFRVVHRFIGGCLELIYMI